MNVVPQPPVWKTRAHTQTTTVRVIGTADRPLVAASNPLLDYIKGRSIMIDSSELLAPPLHHQATDCGSRYAIFVEKGVVKFGEIKC